MESRRSEGATSGQSSRYIKICFARTHEVLKRPMRWQLFALDISSTVPIAFFQRCQPYVTDTNPEPLPAMLHLAPRAEEIREDVVFSFLFMEKNRRVDYTLNLAANSVAYGAAGPAAAAG